MTRFTLKSTLLPVALLAAAPVVLHAQVSDPAPAAAQAGNYKVETSHTRVGFAVNHFGFSDWFGEFADVTGTLSIDPARIEKAKVAVTIPVATVSTTNATLDGELVSADWFDAETYPTIQFVSTKVVRTGERTADVTGNLTFHGVTKPVTLKASFNAGGVNPMSKAYTVGFNASGTIKRSDFGVTKYVPVVGDDVTLRISAAVEKAE